MAMNQSPAEAKAKKEQTKKQTEQAMGINTSNVEKIIIQNTDGTAQEIKITAPEPEFKIEKKVIKSKRKNLVLYAHINDGIELLAKKYDTSFNNLVNLILEKFIEEHSK